VSAAAEVTAPVKPTLHEIAAMPFPASRNAMRKHYNPHWGELTPDRPSDAVDKQFVVTIEYSTMRYDEEYLTITAATAEEAEHRARQEFRDEHSSDDEIDSVSVREQDA
jgi:hypothetical protein